MQYTEKYQFNLIEKEDSFLPDPLNENMEKTEAVLAALDAAMGTGGSTCRVIHGSYVGTGEDIYITFPFKPLAVLLTCYRGTGYDVVAVLVRGAENVEAIGAPSISGIVWSDTSVSFGATDYFGREGRTTYYVAIGE